MRQFFIAAGNVFNWALGLFIISVIIETIWKGSVSSLINLNVFLVLVIALGILRYAGLALKRWRPEKRRNKKI